MTPTAFVTGGTGFLGQNLVEVLRAANWRVIALHRPNARTDLIEQLGAELAEGDITEPDSLSRAMPEGVDAVFHTAAMTSVWKKQAAEQTRINVDGTRNMIAAALAAGAGRFIHTSTWNVFDWDQGPLTEATPKTGRDSWINYNRTKHLAEIAVLDAVTDQGLDAVILNPSHIVGRYDRHNWARMIAMTAMRKLPGVPIGAGDFAHGAAVARAHLAAVKKGRTGENYLLGGPHATFREFVEIAARLSNQKGLNIRRVTPGMLNMIARIEGVLSGLTGRMPQVTREAAQMVSHTVTISSTKALDELGYETVSLEAAIEESYKWLMKARIIRS